MKSRFQFSFCFLLCGAACLYMFSACGGGRQTSAPAEAPAPTVTSSPAKPVGPASEQISALMEPVASVLGRYETIRKSLTEGKLEGVAEISREIAALVRKDSMKMLPEDAAAAADRLAASKNLDEARNAFDQLSQPLLSYLEKNKVTGSGWNGMSCPMSKQQWLQKGEQVQNPYGGPQMTGCGEMKNRF